MVILIRLEYLDDSLNIYGMKLNEVRFSLGTVITHSLDKPYRE